MITPIATVSHYNSYISRHLLTLNSNFQHVNVTVLDHLPSHAVHLEYAIAEVTLLATSVQLVNLDIMDSLTVKVLYHEDEIIYYVILNYFSM